jgi:hypothetical protein
MVDDCCANTQLLQLSFKGELEKRKEEGGGRSEVNESRSGEDSDVMWDE